VDSLTNLGLKDKTLVVVVSDHGEAFGEHGSEGHARNLYGEVSRTPWVISPPFLLQKGVVVETPTANVDVWPTLAEILGIEMGDTDGKSRLAEIEGANPRAEESASGSPAVRFGQLDQTWGRPDESPNPLVSVTSGPYRFFHHPNDPEARELYDVRDDPIERTNIASDHPDVVRNLQAQADAYLVDDAAPWGTPAPQVELDDFNLQQLRALGYVIE
jgi:arylsulfatase A-like enzyme